MRLPAISMQFTLLRHHRCAASLLPGHAVHPSPCLPCLPAPLQPWAPVGPPPMRPCAVPMPPGATCARAGCGAPAPSLFAPLGRSWRQPRRLMSQCAAAPSASSWPAPCSSEVGATSPAAKLQSLPWLALSTASSGNHASVRLAVGVLPSLFPPRVDACRRDLATLRLHRMCPVQACGWRFWSGGPCRGGRKSGTSAARNWLSW